MKISALFAFLALAGGAAAFEVTKNVNTGQPPVEKVILFQKGQPPDSMTLFDNENCRMVFTPDGTIEARITGNGEVKCGVNWNPKLAETFNTKDYGHVVITCRMEGSNKTTGSDQPGQRPDNLWFPATLFNAAGQPVGSAILADGTPDGRTPDQTTTIVLPMLLFTYFGDHDTSQVRGIGFTWTKTRANINRDYRLVIEKIALAE